MENTHFPIQFVFQKLHPLHLSIKEWKDLIRGKKTSKCLFPRRNIVYKYKSNERKVLQDWKNVKNILQVSI